MRRMTSTGVAGRPRVLLFLAAFCQFVLDERKQSVVLESLVGVTHPGFPQIVNIPGNEAISEAALQAARGDHAPRSFSCNSSRSRRNKNWLSSLMASRVSFVSR